MKQLSQIQRELQSLQYQLVRMLAKFAIVVAGLGLALGLIAMFGGLLVFIIAALFILGIGLYLFKKWYVRYKILRKNYFEFENSFKKIYRRAQKGSTKCQD